ncbi:LysR family transcriptional regulator [Gulosibacter macacae]|uniref:LysR family transcriptional regulator n=1 Tax=Gulosibacter macacae TaxID=2488791 RepID=A0A3P3VYG4_9MICO|nr:LysR family transcriptional regulator [Gulosibacter macacae]RRJ85713.1 LysR family transcriptional regulator [Gulosibacter macacae]
MDYNLLRPLRALLEERSVTRAAERLHLSQPSMSGALAKLRAHYEDELLVRRGNLHELTPLAERLLGVLPTAISEVDHVLRLQSGFEPASSERTFVIAGVDAAIARVAPPLLQLVAAEAPGVRFEFPAVDGRLVASVPDSLRTIDGAVLPHGYASGLARLDLPPESWVCLVDAEAGEKGLLDRPWVETIPAREGLPPAAMQLRMRGIELVTVAATPHFFVLPSLLIGTDRVALVPRDLAERVVANIDRLRMVATPVELEPIRDAFWWHGDHERDEGHRWLRGALAVVRDGLIGGTDGDYRGLDLQ